MQRLGPSGLWWFVGTMLLVFALGIAQQRRQKPRPVLQETEHFVLSASLTPAGLELDPRAEDAEATASADPSSLALEPGKI
jgi:hypothetical protein